MKKFKLNKKGSTFFILFAYLVLGITILGYTYDLCRVMYYKVVLKNTASVIALSVTNRCHYLSSSTIDLSENTDMTDSPITVVIMEDPINAQYGTGNRVDMEMYKDYITQLENNQLPYYADVGENGHVSGTFINVDKSENESQSVGAEPINKNFNIVYASHEYMENLIKAQKKNGYNSKMSLAKINNNTPTSNNWDGKDFIISLNESDINRNLSTSNEGITSSMINAYIQAYSQAEVTGVYDNIQNLNRYVNGKDGKNGEVEIYLVGYVKYFFLGNGFFSGMQPYTRIYTVVMAQPQIYTENLSIVGNNSSGGSTIYKK